MKFHLSLGEQKLASTHWIKKSNWDYLFQSNIFKYRIFKHSLLELTLVCAIGLSFFAFTESVVAETLPMQANKIKNILVFGDSLSAAYGIPQNQGWAALLQQRLKNARYQYQVTNASISGETTSGGASKIEAQLKRVHPDIVILALGANDGLRGLPVIEMHKNLQNIITKSQKNGAKVLLLGMKIPPNYGPQYTQSFSQTYQTLSREYHIPLVPFMLENIAVNTALIQDDGLHPNSKAQPILLENIWPTLITLLKK